MFSKAPFVGFVLIYMAGIVAGNILSAFAAAAVWPCLLASLCLVLAALFLYYKQQIARAAAAVSVLFFLLGLSGKMLVESRQEEKFALLSPKHEVFIAEIQSLPEKRTYASRYEASVRRVYQNGRWQDFEAKILLNVPPGADLPALGDLILVKEKLKTPAPPQNPEQFDYQRYLHGKGILWTAQIRKGQFALLPGEAAKLNINAVAQEVSAWADDIFSRNISDSSSYGLIKAMVLGRRDDLNPDQVNSYIGSGTVHILSVSGMHVAILFLMVSTALGWLKRYRFGKIVYLFLIIALLAFYSLVTGLSPSVQRSAIMCAIFVIAEVSGRKNHSMNTLAISALLILLFDPQALFDVGFQLSYLAMSGIFLFYEPINALFTPGNRLTRFVWQVSALSFAAQLATFPLSIYYFHQFPTYFWLANPLVIAFTNVLLPAAMILLAVDFLNVALLTSAVTFVTQWSAKLANWCVKIPEQLPSYLFENLHVSLTEMLLLYILMLLIWLAYELQDFAFVKYSAMVTVLFVSVSVSLSIQNFVTPEMQVFSIRGERVAGFKTGSQLHLVTSKNLHLDQRSFNFNIKPFATEREIGSVIFVNGNREIHY